MFKDLAVLAVAETGETRKDFGGCDSFGLGDDKAAIAYLFKGKLIIAENLLWLHVN